MQHIAQVIPAAMPREPKTIDDLLERFRQDEALENPDQIVQAKDLRFTAERTLAVPSLGDFYLNDWSRKQLAILIGVSWDRWFANSTPQEQALEINKRLWSNDARIRVRTSRAAPSTNGTKGMLRAFVSPTFTPLPDSELLGLIQETLAPLEPVLQVRRSNVTNMTASYCIGLGEPFRPYDNHEIGDMQMTITVSNSSVGYAAATIVASLLRLACKNGMMMPISNATLLHRVHRKFDLGKLKASLVEQLNGLPARVAAAGRVLVDSHSHAVVDVKAEFIEILRIARAPISILPQLERAYTHELRIRGTLFGVSQAATRAAQELKPELRLQLERAAGVYLKTKVTKVN